MKVFRVRKPLCLQKGDSIGVVAPAWSFDHERFRLGAAKLLEFSWEAICHCS